MALLAIPIVGSAGIYAALGGFGGPLKPAEAEAKLEAMLRDVVANNKAVRSGVLRVEAPALGVSGAWAAGVADERSSGDDGKHAVPLRQHRQAVHCGDSAGAGRRAFFPWTMT